MLDKVRKDLFAGLGVGFGGQGFVDAIRYCLRHVLS
jgi:hypothetical protein